jgi:catechol 2,3-dioxygenase-like lactoylglutathione lyase family enzyme
MMLKLMLRRASDIISKKRPSGGSHMSLGNYPMAAIWLYCRDVKASSAFYEGTLGLPKIDEHGDTAHFNAGGIRLSLHPTSAKSAFNEEFFLVFDIPKDIDRVYTELDKRGVRFDGPLKEEAFGRAASFRDPDGHQIFIWQPPAPGDSRYPMVARLVSHYDSLARVLGVPKESEPSR